MDFEDDVDAFSLDFGGDFWVVVGADVEDELGVDGSAPASSKGTTTPPAATWAPAWPAAELACSGSATRPTAASPTAVATPVKASHEPTTALLRPSRRLTLLSKAIRR